MLNTHDNNSYTILYSVCITRVDFKSRLIQRNLKISKDYVLKSASQLLYVFWLQNTYDVIGGNS